MPITVTTTPYGAAAHEALAAEVARLKAGDPLRPVSVLVSANQVGLAARRALGRRGGVAAVTFLTPFRLAELLGGSSIALFGRVGGAFARRRRSLAPTSAGGAGT